MGKKGGVKKLSNRKIGNEKLKAITNTKSNCSFEQINGVIFSTIPEKMKVKVVANKSRKF